MLLPRRRAQSMPGVADLLVMHFRQIVRRIERQRLDVEPADGAEQRIGGDHAIALRADQPRFGRNQIGLRVQDVDRGALPALRLLADALQRNGRRAHFDSDAATAILAPSFATQAPTAAVRAWLRT